jgi:hypothetical protein
VAQIVDRRAVIEYVAKRLTRPQIAALRRVRDDGPNAWDAGLSRAGGAVSRMFDRLEEMALVTDAPHKITQHGRAVLAAVDAP